MRRFSAFVLVVLVVLAGCGGTEEVATVETPTTVAPGEPPGTVTTPEQTTETATTGATITTRSRTPTPTTVSGSTPATTTSSSEKQQWTVEVVRVVDGDTLEVEFPDGHVEDVRLLGVDTPEVHTAVDPAEFEGIPDTEAGRDWLRDWGHKASEFTRSKVAGETLEISVDPEADRRGSFGRLLVYVHLGGTTLNRQLLEQGYARYYDSMFSKADSFELAETNARSADVGLWDFERSTTTTDGGVSLVVAEIHADAQGDDHDNLNDEYIVLENTGSSTIDLSGWTLRDEADHVYTFPDGFTLAAGETVTIRTGSGTDTEDTLYWGSGSAIWNNGGDTIIIRDESGQLMLEREYS
jgi:micrococcal nuclease